MIYGMSEPRKKPGVVFWATVVVVVALALVLAYPLSFGPARGLVSHAHLSARLVSVPYRPLLWADRVGPRWWRRWTREYSFRVSADGWGLMDRTDWESGVTVTDWGPFQ